MATEIDRTVNRYLEMIERLLGLEARRHTVIEHRGGRNLYLKPPFVEQGRLVDVSTLVQMIHHAETRGRRGDG